MPAVSVGEFIADEPIKDAFIKNAMGAACGVMGWPPDAFWHATPFDFLNAWRGFEHFHGLKPAHDLSHDDVRHLRELLNENTSEKTYGL